MTGGGLINFAPVILLNVPISITAPIDMHDNNNAISNGENSTVERLNGVAQWSDNNNAQTEGDNR